MDILTESTAGGGNEAAEFVLNPEVKVSDLDAFLLPLGSFHVVVVVEPDPDTWMVIPGEEGVTRETLEMYSSLITNELYNIDDESPVAEPASILEDTSLIVVRESGGYAYTFTDVTDFSDFIINSDEPQFPKLATLLAGIAATRPDSKVAIVGGMASDEVIRVANAVQSAGFDTTVVKRYCLSGDIMVNLDDLFDGMGI